MNDGWHHDDYPTLEEEAFLNTIWEECTADLRSKSTVDFNSFDSDLTGFNSAQHLLDRQDNESIVSINSTGRLSVFGEEEEEEEGDNDSSCSSSTIVSVDDFVMQLQCHEPNKDEASETDTQKPSLADDSLDETMVTDPEALAASPRTSVLHSNKSHTIIKPSPSPQSPRSPMEIFTTETMRTKGCFHEPAEDSDGSSHRSCSRRIDFSGRVIIEQENSREHKRERIRSKMKAIEEKVMMAKDILNPYYASE